MCVGIVGHADLTLGTAVRPVLEAHSIAGGGRFRGIRHISSWDADPGLMNPGYSVPEDLFLKPASALVSPNLASSTYPSTLGFITLRSRN